MVQLAVNETRFWNDFEQVSQIGSTGDGGVSRTALSSNDVITRQWFQQRIADEGFEYQIDGAGNQSAIWRCPNPTAPTLLIGSHLDSVKNGGRFDGALGVLCAYEAMRTLRDAGEGLPFHLETINFTDEEGSLVGLMGSSALAGALTKAELEQPRGGRETVLDGMARIGIDDDSVLNAKRDPQLLRGYFEVHIEQGTRLENSAVDIGIVTTLVGSRAYWLTFSGEAAHAGTMPMGQRQDALWGAADFTLRAKQMVIDHYFPGVCNVGQAMVRPGAFNIVPGQVDISLEFRHGSLEDLDTMETALLALGKEVAEQYHLELTVKAVDKKSPSMMDEAMMGALETACEDLGLSHQRLLSFALHDAQYLSQMMPTAMFFVPSVGGISHNPAEFTHRHDCINGAKVLLKAILVLKDSG